MKEATFDPFEYSPPEEAAFQPFSAPNKFDQTNSNSEFNQKTASRNRNNPITITSSCSSPNSHKNDSHISSQTSRNQKNISLNDSNFSSPTTGMLNMSSSFGSPSRHKSDVSSTSRNRSKISLNDSNCSSQTKRILKSCFSNTSMNNSFDPFLSEVDTDLASETPMSQASNSFNSDFNLATINSSEIKRKIVPLKDNVSLVSKSKGVSGTLTKETPVAIALHEEMNFTHDLSSNKISMVVEGNIEIRTKPALEGVPFYLSLKNSEKFVSDLSPSFEYVVEVTESYEDQQQAYVNSNLEQGNRVFRVDIPAMTGHKESIQLIKYKCRKNIHTAPLLVQTNICCAGQYCEVNIELRSNPLNSDTTQNISVLMAVPSQLDGESMTISRKGAMWDAMKRTVVLSIPKIENGGIIVVKIRFETVPPFEVTGVDDLLFPVLVRCGGRIGTLNSIDINISGACGKKSKSSLALVLRKFYRLFHRVI